MNYSFFFIVLLCTSQVSGQAMFWLYQGTSQYICGLYGPARIISADYGTPCAYFSTGTCHAATTYSTVYNWCINRNSCQIPKNVHKVLGDPCPGTPKVIAVRVRCSGGVYPDNNVCIYQTDTQSDPSTIKCPLNSQTIVAIEFASYGTPMFDSSDVWSNPFCTMSMSSLYNNCNGQLTCEISASNLPDHCQGSSKYLQVRYTCG